MHLPIFIHLLFLAGGKKVKVGSVRFCLPRKRIVMTCAICHSQECNNEVSMITVMVF